MSEITIRIINVKEMKKKVTYREANQLKGDIKLKNEQEATKPCHKTPNCFKRKLKLLETFRTSMPPRAENLLLS